MHSLTHSIFRKLQPPAVLGIEDMNESDSAGPLFKVPVYWGGQASENSVIRKQDKSYAKALYTIFWVQRKKLGTVN